MSQISKSDDTDLSSFSMDSNLCHYFLIGVIIFVICGIRGL